LDSGSRNRFHSDVRNEAARWLSIAALAPKHAHKPAKIAQLVALRGKMETDGMRIRIVIHHIIMTALRPHTRRAMW
jgi:hypothetical protein